MPFGFGQENGITEKNPTFNKILLLEGLFSGFKTIKSWSGNTDRGRKKQPPIIGQEQVEGVCTQTCISASERGDGGLARWGHFCYLR